jgi:nicotinate-nucleotide adenylyltransferase
MKVAVYSGSFNPLHIGHLAIIKQMIEMACFDMVYLVVSPKNPLKDTISSDSGTDRYNAAIAAVNRHFATSDKAVVPMTPVLAGPGHPLAGGGMSSPQFALSDAVKVYVDDIELRMPEPHYTIRTLDALKEREPQNEFTLIMGADNLADIRRWKEAARILTDYGVAVYPREGFDLETVRQDLLNENPAYKIQIIDAQMVNISSTQIREAASRGEDVSHLLM